MRDIVKELDAYVYSDEDNVAPIQFKPDPELIREAAEEIKQLRREVITLRNFLGAIKVNVDLAIGNYGQPMGGPDA